MYYTAVRSSDTIPALSVRAPWAWAIMHAGKRIENRNWITRYRGVIYLHASRKSNAAECDEIARICGRRPPKDMMRGALVATMTLVDIVPISKMKRDPWASGPWCWLIDKIKLITPRYMRGFLGLWYPPK